MTASREARNKKINKISRAYVKRKLGSCFIFAVKSDYTKKQKNVTINGKTEDGKVRFGKIRNSRSDG